MPDVLRALIRESKAGNVQAIRLVLEHTNRLQKHINIRVSSPFEQWLASNDNNQIEEAEIVLESMPPLPTRIADNTPKKPHNDFIRLDQELQKKQSWNERRKELHQWNKRAKACGIAPLPPKRPTKGQRKEWVDSIVTAEGL